MSKLQRFVKNKHISKTHLTCVPGVGNQASECLKKHHITNTEQLFILFLALENRNTSDKKSVFVNYLCRCGIDTNAANVIRSAMAQKAVSLLGDPDESLNECCSFLSILADFLSGVPVEKEEMSQVDVKIEEQRAHDFVYVPDSF